VPLVGPNSAIGMRMSPPTTTPRIIARKPSQKESPNTRMGNAPRTTVANVLPPPNATRKRSNGVAVRSLRGDGLDAVLLDFGGGGRLVRAPLLIRGRHHRLRRLRKGERRLAAGTTPARSISCSRFSGQTSTRAVALAAQHTPTSRRSPHFAALPGLSWNVWLAGAARTPTALSTPGLSAPRWRPSSTCSRTRTPASSAYSRADAVSREARGTSLSRSRTRPPRG
jgi:hypothetical protein